MAKKSAKGNPSSDGAQRRKKNSGVPRSKKSGGGKAIVTLLIILLIGGGLFYLYKYTSVFDTFKQYKDEYISTSASDMSDYQADYTASDSDTAADEHSNGFLSGLFNSCRGIQSADTAAADRMSGVSASDAQEIVPWQQVETDEEYKNMMLGKIDEVITLLAKLDDLKKDLSECKTTSQVETNEQYMAVRRELTGWCDSAQNYSAAALGESSQKAAETAFEIASDARSYLAIYPSAVCGDESASQKAAELTERIVSNVFSLQNTLTSQEND